MSRTLRICYDHQKFREIEEWPFSTESQGFKLKHNLAVKSIEKKWTVTGRLSVFWNVSRDKTFLSLVHYSKLDETWKVEIKKTF